MSPVFWGNVDLYYTKDVRCSHQVNKRLQIAVKIQKLIRINRITKCNEKPFTQKLCYSG
ncbi:hypothetical protein OROHE_008737 [Orobanche hederae]